MTTENLALSEVAEINPRVELRNLRDDTVVSFVPMSDVSESGRWVGRQERRLDQVRVGYTPFAEGDLLFAKITPCMENGKGAHAVGLRNGIGFGSTEFHVLRVRDGFNQRFLHHWLQEKSTRTRAIAFMGGSAGQQRVQADFFSHFRIPHIGSDEQTQIAAVLDTVDEAIGKTEQVIAKLKQVRAGLLHDLLTRGLDEHGQLRDPLAHPEQFQDSPLGQIPKSWEFDTFAGLMGKRIIIDIQDGNHGESHPKESDYVEDGVPFVMAADIAADEINLGRCKRIPHALVRRLRIGHARPGDVLLSHKASVGFVAMVRPEHGEVMLTPQVTYYRIGQPDRLDSSFLAWLMRGHRFQRQLESLAAQSTRDYVGITMQKTLIIAIPSSLEEQAAIVAHLTAIQLQLRAEEENLAKIRNLKSGLMTDLLTGRVPVPADLLRETVQ